jgi:hypothetical protein
MENKATKIVFLDIDGVLNGDSPMHRFIFIHICEKNTFFLKLWHKWDIYGVRTLKVFLLWILLKLTNAKVVLSSSWRRNYFSSNNTNRVKCLKKNFKFFGIKVVGATPTINSSERGMEILSWLSEHPEVKSFVVLDDEDFDLKETVSDYFVKTSNITLDQRIKGDIDHEKSGLSVKHIIAAIKILKKIK